MKKIPDIQATIQLDSIGEKTQSRWVGTFVIKRQLSHADRFALTRMYNGLLPSGMEVQEELKIRAATIAELYVRVVSAPEWWEGCGKGQLLIDSDPLYDLITKCNEAEIAWCKELETEAKTEASNVVTDKKSS